MPLSRRMFMVSAGGIGLSAAQAASSTGHTPSQHRGSELVLGIEQVQLGLHAVTVEHFQSLMTTAELDAAQRAVPGASVRGAPIARCTFTLTNTSDANYLLSASSVEGMLVHAVEWIGESDSRWRLARTVSGHPEGMSYQLPLLGGTTKRFYWDLWHADLEPVALTNANSLFATRLLSFRLRTGSFLHARQLLEQRLGEPEEVSLTGAGRCVVTREG